LFTVFLWNTLNFLKPDTRITFNRIMIDSNCQTTASASPSFSAENPAKRISAESEEIPATVQFSAKPETERWREFLNW